MSEFTSEPSQAAQEEVEQIAATPEQADPLVKDPSAWVSGETLPAELSKAEASQHIDRLRDQLGIAE